jgi:hypothetical protein
MAYKIKSKKPKEKLNKEFYSEKQEQTEINHLLFKEKRVQDTEPKKLTIVIKKEKEQHFAFLKDETEFEVQGKWHDKKHKLFQENNAEIEVLFYDDKDHRKSNLLLSKFRDYNRKYIKEKVLFVTISPIDKSSI